MPVSPQDFELYSRMTGAPMPSDAMSRMQMAPDVYKFTKNYAKKPNLLEKTGNLVKNIGKGAVMAIGAPLVAASEAEQARMQEQLRNKADKAQSEAVTMSESPEQVSEKLQIEQEKTRRKKIEIAGRLDLENMRMTGQPSTTAGNYGQNVVINSTAQNVIDKKMEQGSQMADNVPNVAEVLSEAEESAPASLYGTNPLNVPRLMSEDVGTTASPEFISKFRKKRGLDKALKGAFAIGSQKKEELVDDRTIFVEPTRSPLNDHPDVKDVSGGEEPNPRMGTNTSPTQDLNSFYKEMRKMDAQERSKRVSPSDKQMNLLEKRAIDNENALKSGFMNLDDEGRAKETARLGGDRIREMAKKSPDAISGTDIKRTGLLSGQLTRFPAGEETRKAEERKRLRRERNANMSTAEKADDFTAKFVEGARSDIVRGQRGNKSLGITRIPATNGDSQVGFVLANKPIDQKPKFATTYGFGVAPGAEDIIKGSLDTNTFDSYMDRGMKEARQGKKRKAGEIFEYLIPQQRIVTGDARLGDIVM